MTVFPRNMTDEQLKRYIEILERVEENTAGLLKLLDLDPLLKAIIGTAEHVIVLHNRVSHVLEALQAEQNRRSKNV